MLLPYFMLFFQILQDVGWLYVIPNRPPCHPEPTIFSKSLILLKNVAPDLIRGLYCFRISEIKRDAEQAQFFSPVTIHVSA